MNTANYSENYHQARARFVSAVAEVHGVLHTYPVHQDTASELSIDVAIIGEDSADAVVVSSGMHGVEGFFGSAVQMTLLERLRLGEASPAVKYVLIHAINPYGFSHRRRFNEDNIDLNRNFLDETAVYAGSPTGYSRLNRFLNPQSGPSRFEPFRIKALWNIWRSGMASLKGSIAGGQYDFPQGLFFGGHQASRSNLVIRNHFDDWLGASVRVFHIDLHTGLGKYGQVKLLLNGLNSSSDQWATRVFGAELVEALMSNDGTAYEVSGHFGRWIETRHSAARDYRFIGAEYGTYDVIRVLKALRTENRAHHFAAPGSAASLAAKRELQECFCPQDLQWRKQVLGSALELVDKGVGALGDGLGDSLADGIEG